MVKVKVLFFANYRELLDCNELEVEINKGSSVGQLCQFLSQKGDVWHQLFANPGSTIKIALNQEMAELSSIINENDEVAFFPPVTGG
ncbi:molybdopterin converting factor subunit 1 [Aliikangiella coralliicola]|uniref:Molybdopterin synthase sulfur carrier subunit n=1 Tax=Aliikangiella coralliicola TaxID=2592383 RepID=A0A545U4R7_9GAMM|nr:molybdopterin converting factor subunit 1 [Aliikangiella coralliicola]TQV84458.1 molybdopterin converting factor subunit 1 [Aliikangiella coralliicola]